MMLGGYLWLNTQELPLEASRCLGSNSGQLHTRQAHSCAVGTLAQDTSFVRNLLFFFVGIVWVTRMAMAMVVGVTPCPLP